VPGLQIYRSNRIEALAEILIELLQNPEQRPSDPMEVIEVVVGSSGLARWLRHRIATKVGVCAQMDFPFPAQFIQRQLSHILSEPKAASADPWSQEAISLAILEAIGSEALKNTPLGRIQTGPEEPVTAQDLSTASEVARVFDRYGVYRPALIRSWCGLPEHDPPTLPSQLQWQAEVWQSLTNKLDSTQHFATRIARAKAILQGGDVDLKGPIRVFGFSSLPPAWLEFLWDVAQVIDVHLFALCPSIEGWNRLHAHSADAARLRKVDRERELSGQLNLDSIHPLHESLGRSARDTQLVLESLDGYHLGVVVDETLNEVDSASALHTLQADILQCRHPEGGDQRSELSPDDRSIQFHACHGPARQVEVIRDVILDLLDRHDDLEPRDIVIMTPEITTYAPLLEGSFGRGQWTKGAGASPWGESGTPRIPVEIADLSVRRTNPVADALLRVLDVAAHRLTASAALDLIALEPVATRFGFGPEDSGTLREIVSECEIRWGLDENDRAQSGYTPDEQNTFAFGLDRLAMGVVMADEGDAVHLTEDDTSITPWDGAEPAETLSLLGKFFEFCDVLGEEVRGLRQSRPLEDWLAQLLTPEKGTIDRLTRTEGVSQWLTQRVRTELTSLAEQSQTAGSQRALQLDAVQALLEGRFDVPSAVTREHTGSTTCCAMKPMRSVPYRVVCLLGMDEGTFPRQGSLPGFDWTGLSPRAGDRIPRDEDRLMLLEAILSARSHMVVTYTGKNVRTNETCQPCAPITELRDVIDRTFQTIHGDSAAQSLTREHPLHAFNPTNFQTSETGEPPWSYDPGLLAAAEAGRRRPHTPRFLPDDTQLPHARREPDSVVEIDALSDFLSNPTRALLKQRFGLRLREYTTEVEDQVPVELSKRQRRKIDRTLLEHTQETLHSLGTDVPDESAEWLAPMVAHLRGTGQLPLGAAGIHALSASLATLDKLRSECSPLLMEKSQTKHVRVPLTLQGRSIEIVGSVPHIHNDAMILFVAAPDATSGSMWWLITPWIRMLAWMAEDPSAPRRLGVVHAYHDDKTGPKLQYRVFAPGWGADEQQERATEILHWMVGVQQTGMDSPLPLFPRTSFQFAKSVLAHNQQQDPSSTIGVENFEPGGNTPNPWAMTEIMKQSRAAWGTPDSRAGDAKEVHLAHLYAGARPFLEDETAWPQSPEPRFAAAALRMWLPLLEARQVIRGGKASFRKFMEALYPSAVA